MDISVYTSCTYVTETVFYCSENNPSKLKGFLHFNPYTANVDNMVSS